MIILIGASASGKTEIVKELVKNHNMKKLITCTSREKRIGEINDMDYHFFKKDDFLKRIDNNEFFEYVTYNNNLYGTLKEDISDDKVVILEPSGFKAYYDAKVKNVYSFFLYTDTKTRRERMVKRGDEPIKIEERLEADKTVFDSSLIEGLDYIIDSSYMKVEDLAKFIMDLYKKKLEG